MNVIFKIHFYNFYPDDLLIHEDAFNKSITYLIYYSIWYLSYLLGTEIF